MLSKQSVTHFLTAYLEYLLDEGIRSEYYYFGDASRYMRFLLRESGIQQIEAFIGASQSEAYRRRLTTTLRKFYAFAEERLQIDTNPLR